MSTGKIEAGGKSDVVFAVTRGALFKLLTVMLIPGIGVLASALWVAFTVQQHTEEIKDIKIEQRELRRDLTEIKTAKRP